MAAGLNGKWRGSDLRVLNNIHSSNRWIERGSDLCFLRRQGEKKDK